MRTRMAWAAVAAGVVAMGVLLWLRLAPRERGALGPGAYALRYQFEMDLAEAGGRASHVSAAVDGTLDMVDREGQRVARVRLGTLTLNEDAQRAGFQRAAAEAALGMPFFLALAPDGSVTQVRLFAQAPLAVRSVLATVAQGTQYVSSSRSDAEDWATAETDMNGSYRAVYRYTSATVVQKAFDLGQKDHLGSVRGRATATYKLDGGRVVNVALQQQGEALTGSSTGPRSPFRIQVTLAYRGSPDESWVTEALQREGLAEDFETRTGVPRNLRVSGPAPRPADQLMAAYAAAEPSGTLAQHNLLRNELTEAAARSPAIAESLEKVLRHPKSALLQRRLAVEALLGARTPQTDARAASMTEDKTLSMDVRIMFLGGATTLENPGRTVVQAVRNVMNSRESPIFGHAAMAMGGILSRHVRDGELLAFQGAPTASTGAEGGPTLPGTGYPGELSAEAAAGRVRPPPVGGGASSSSRGVDAGPARDASAGNTGSPDAGTAAPDPDAEMVAELLAMAGHVLDPGPNATRMPFGIKASFIRALGNLGTTACIPLVRVGLADDNLLVRAAAANALRFQPPALVKQDLARAMRDPEMEVRGAALKAARKMGPGATLDLAQTALMFDKSENVRLQAVYTFGAWAHEAPVLRAKLTEASEHEKSPKVQQAIRHMLQPNRIEPPFVQEPITEARP